MVPSAVHEQHHHRAEKPDRHGAGRRKAGTDEADECPADEAATQVARAVPPAAGSANRAGTDRRRTARVASRAGPSVYRAAPAESQAGADAVTVHPVENSASHFEADDHPAVVDAVSGASVPAGWAPRDGRND